MERAQATVEYLLLAMAVIVGGCLLVRFATPVEAVARAVVHAVAPRPPHGAPAHPRRSRPASQPRRHRTPRPCLCPLTSGAGVDPARARTAG